MEALGFEVTIEEGNTGQFELFKWSTTLWMSFMKEGHGKFFTLNDVEKKLSE
jgi:hypothetical protein|tara:strand:- start:368 stop:523 length:156 start_codon:yes stop_codon:yes gene_type:complete